MKHFLGSKTRQVRELTNPFKIRGCCHGSDHLRGLSLLILVHLLMFLLVPGCPHVPRSSPRRQRSSQRVQARAGHHRGRIVIIVHGIKDGEKKHSWPLNEDCREGQHLMVCEHKLRAINALPVPTIIPFWTGSPDEYKEYWFSNPCRFLETMQTDLIIINKIYRQWCNPAEIFLSKVWHKNTPISLLHC